jgi:hypothetical protein
MTFIMMYKNAQLLLSPSVATILHSYNCTAACEHCCFDSHPGIKKRLSLKQILKFIEEAATFKTMKLIVFSGGECFLLGKDLDVAIAFATKLNLMTRCVSNGYWAKDYKIGYERLSRLKEAGLKELNISTGDFHQKHVPQNHVINGTIAAANLGISIVVVIEMQKERKVTAANFTNDVRIQNLLRTDAGKLLKIVESPWMPMSAEEVIQQPKGNLVDRYNVHKRKGCKSILTTLVATPSEKMGICCGLSRELIPELNVALPENYSLQNTYYKNATDFVKIWLFVDGPERILAWAALKDPSIKWEGKFAHICHACLGLFKDEKVKKVIREHYQEKIDEVLLRYSLIAQSGKALSPELEAY